MNHEANSTTATRALGRADWMGVAAIVVALVVGLAVGWYGKRTVLGSATASLSQQGWEALTRGDAAAGKVAFKELQCSSCHRVVGHPDLPAPTASPIVPVDLGAEPHQPTRGQLVDSILVPSHRIEPGYLNSMVQSGQLSRMGDYSHLLTVQQLADLVAFLESIPRKQVPAKGFE